MRPLRRGELVDLEVETLASGPDALARRGGYVVLLPGALPGERVCARVTSAARKFGRAQVDRVLRAAPERTVPRCRHFLACGGCHWQHLRYDGQLRAKAQRLHRELLHALGADAPPVLPAVAAPAPWGQRHKVALHLLPGPRGAPVPALHGLRDRGLVELAECPAAAPAAFALGRRAIALLGRLGASLYDPATGLGELRSVLVRRAASTGESHLVVVASARPRGLAALVPELLAAGATTVSLNLNDGPAGRLLGPRTEVLAGPRRIRERLDDTTFCISPDAFFQTSPAGAAALLDAVRAALQPRPADVLADLYCGVGLFALPLARAVRAVVGIEESATAIGDAAASARLNGRHNVQWVRAAVEHGLARLGRGLPRPDLCVLDPPRAGCTPAALRRLAGLAPRRLAYVSCDPAALARDLALLRPLGYRATAVLPVDMFPHTHHVEAVATIECTERAERTGPAVPRGAHSG